MIGDAFQPRHRLRASQLNELARSADSAHLGAAGFLSQENGLEQVARSPRRMSPIVKATPSTSSDGAIIGIVQSNSTDSGTSNYGSEVNQNQLKVTLYPNWPETTGSRTAWLYTPCVYRRAPLFVGDPILCHPCSIAVTTEGEES